MPEGPSARLAALYRYPIKGLSPEPLTHTHLEARGGVPGDRLYAIENGPSGFDTAAPRFLPKAHFLMLMMNETLAALSTRFDAASRCLSIARGDDTLLCENLDSEAGRRVVEAFFDAYSAADLRGPARVLSAPGHAFWDRGTPLVSLINLASLDELAEHAGAFLHPLRFRANLYVEGLPAWQEFDFVGGHIRIGDVVLKGVDRINRCAAINVDPRTATRDLDLPATLRDHFGHRQCGIYLEIVSGGDIAIGDRIVPE